MPLGDSLTDGVEPNNVQGSYRNELYTLLSAPGQGYVVDFIGTFNDDNNLSLPDTDHQGASGFRTDQIQSNLGGWLGFVEAPDVVLLMIGTNDIWQNRPVATALANLDSLITDIATRLPFAKIVVSTLPVRVDSTYYDNLQKDYNAGIPAIVADHVALGHQVSMVDMHPVLKKPDFSPADGVHPKKSGYDKMAGVWSPAVNAVITPLGTSNPPVIARATGLDSLTQVAVTFSKPVADDAADLSNFSFSGGLTISAAELDTATKRTVTLTTSAQSPATIYTLTVNGVRDRTPQQNPIAPDSMTNFQGILLTNGGFENGTTGWNLTGNVEQKNSTGIYKASEGSFLIAFNSGQSTPNGLVSRTINTSIGQTYRLSFDAGIVAYNYNEQKLRLSVQGGSTLISDVTTIKRLTSMNGEVRYIPKSYDFVADTNNITLTFTDISTTSDGVDLLLDNVRFIPVSNLLTSNTLSVSDSLGVGVNMTISPADTQGADDGTTGLIRTYDFGESVTVTTPASHLGKDFLTWQRNGVDIPASTQSITLDINGAQALTAVYEPNTPPLAGNQNLNTNEDTPLAITLTGSDPDGDALTFAVASGPTNGGLSGDPPNLTYTPNPDYNGADSFIFSVDDGIAPPVEATVSITINPVNDAPLADAQSVEVDEDGSVAITLTGSDVDGDTLTFAVATPPANGALTGDTPTLIYTPDPDYHGPDSFTFIVNDGTVDSVEATVSITINPFNDAPVADAQSVEVDEDGSVAITLTGSDVDGDTLTFAVVTPPANGALTGDAPTLIYTPDPDYHGPDSFTFIVNDGTVDSAEATVSITVNPVNDAPLADAQSVEVDEDGSVSITLTGSDVDGDTLTFAVVTPPANGALTGDAPSLIYTPDPDYNGPDSFTFTVNDGTVDSAEATVSITVNKVETAYEEWASGFWPHLDPLDDNDGDSLSNAMEYVLGGNPINENDAGLLPQVELIMSEFDEQNPEPPQLTHLCFIHRLTHLAKDDPLTTVGVEWSTDMTGPWTHADGSNGESTEVDVEGAGAGVDLVRVFVPVPVEGGRLFARLRVSVASQP